MKKSISAALAIVSMVMLVQNGYGMQKTVQPRTLPTNTIYSNDHENAETSLQTILEDVNNSWGAVVNNTKDKTAQDNIAQKGGLTKKSFGRIKPVLPPEFKEFQNTITTIQKLFTTVLNNKINGKLLPTIETNNMTIQLNKARGFMDNYSFELNITPEMQDSFKKVADGFGELAIREKATNPRDKSQRRILKDCQTLAAIFCNTQPQQEDQHQINDTSGQQIDEVDKLQQQQIDELTQRVTALEQQNSQNDELASQEQARQQFANTRGLPYEPATDDELAPQEQARQQFANTRGLPYEPATDEQVDETTTMAGGHIIQRPTRRPLNIRRATSSSAIPARMTMNSRIMPSPARPQDKRVANRAN